ncbi:hypothetical protein PQU94_00465 [Asticcacaulis sp. DXS10W]|uniref:O-antigen ligase domain-containing protein n=1 Tax=Asticcacaulis currens TaxID=2984210 RepID=A0ABT5I991_9CAUL|nr:hypothetical protein [Asticcacaulis currens]MDC7692747.1 hypothetical protein [Asticcacaulis currens]
MIIFAWFHRGNFQIYLAFSLLAFGSLAIVPASMLGGTTILASSMAFLLLSMKSVLVPGGIYQVYIASRDLRGMGFLVVYTVLAVTGAFVLPRAFAGQISAYPAAGFVQPIPIYPSGSNFNQSINLIISCGVAVTFFVLARAENFAYRFAAALIWAGGAVIITGVADMVSPFTGLGGVLEQFRTASYIFMTDNVVLGARRIIGLMPEASSYGTLAAAIGGALLFCRNAFPDRDKWRVAIPIGALCLVLSALSTSSSAYGALAVTGALLVADGFFRLVNGSPKQKAAALRELWFAFCVGMIFICVIVANEGFREFAVRMVETTVLKKSQSTSFAERSAWTFYGMVAFKESMGLGVGIGSVRTSNFFVNVLASTGVVGAVLFGIYVFQVFLAKVWSNNPVDFELTHGLKLSILVAFVGMYLAGTSPDFGVFLGAAFGAIMGISYFSTKHAAKDSV